MNLPPEYEVSLVAQEPMSDNEVEMIKGYMKKGKLDKDEYDERLDDTNPFIKESVIEPEAD